MAGGMEKVSPLTLDEVPAKFSMFRTVMRFADTQWKWTGSNTEVRIETFRSREGRLFSAIVCRKVDKSHIDSVAWYIDDESTHEEIDHFLEIILGGASFAWILHATVETLHYEYLMKGITLRIGDSHAENHDIFEHDLFLSRGARRYSETTALLPGGYTMRPLDESHCDYVAEKWLQDVEFSDPTEQSKVSHMIEVARSNITERPCFAVFRDDETRPVAWICLYPHGSLGMLHVLGGHRGKGLARILIRKMLSTVENSHPGCTLFSCVSKGNTPSFNLFSSEGWELQPHNYKKMFFRK